MYSHVGLAWTKRWGIEKHEAGSAREVVVYQYAMWSQRIHIDFARPHVFGFTPDSLNIDKIVPPGPGSSSSNSESSRTALLSYSFKLFQPAVLSGR